MSVVGTLTMSERNTNTFTTETLFCYNIHGNMYSIHANMYSIHANMYSIRANRTVYMQTGQYTC